MIERIQGGSSDGIDTHTTRYFDIIWKNLTTLIDSPLERICDPFARDCPIAHPYTNDIDPTTEATYCFDAFDFLSSMPSRYFDAVIFDPPFSPRQAEEKYEAGHVNVYSTPGYVPRLMRQIGRILKPGGYVLKFGYNTTNHLSWKLVHVWVVNMGGNRNDVLVSLWQHVQTSLEEFS